MTTPAPEKTAGRRRRSPSGRAPAQHQRPLMRLSRTGWLVSWLLPTLLMGVLLLGLSFIPGLNGAGFLAPLIPVLAGAAVVVGIPGTLLVGYLLRHHLNPVVHVLGYVVVGLLYGPTVLVAGASGLMPMLIPLVGFPAGIMLGATRWAVQPLARIEGDDDPDTEESAEADQGASPH